MQRIIKIEKYRNIGLEKPETLILNHSMEKGKLGDLVILIGANNSGKSNVLDALRSIAQGQLQGRDVTTLSFKDEDRIPSVSFGIQDKEHRHIYYSVGLNKQPEVSINMGNNEKKLLPSREVLISDLQAAQNSFARNGFANDSLTNMLLSIQNSNTKITQEVVNRAMNAIDYTMDMYRRRRGAFSNFANTMPASGYWYSIRAKSGSTIDEANAYCKKTFDVSFLPSIISYKENALNADSLQTSPNSIQDSPFFQSLFRAIGADQAEIGNAYRQYESHHNRVILSKVEKALNSKMTALNKQFNRMYFAESDKYKFSIILESSLVSFGMSRGKDEEPIMLEQQSLGFRWFFNFFFNFISSGQLKAGDIVIMDEPATNLHPKGQQELRAFIKSFARANDLTFILATHSPFLIDPDNYDELRVISMDNNRSKIDNLFTAVNFGDPDSLLPIKEALTIEQHVLYNLKTEVVWVEGITDYNYLTMFKKLLGYENIAFLPCNGIGKDEATQKEVLKRLVAIEFHKRNLLVDGDTAGKKMKSHCKDTVFENAACISDLSTPEKKFVEIEDLFSGEDKEKFGLSEKSAGLSSLMKSTCKLSDFSEETTGNFKRLFKLLTE